MTPFTTKIDTTYITVDRDDITDGNTIYDIEIYDAAASGSVFFSMTTEELRRFIKFFKQIIPVEDQP